MCSDDKHRYRACETLRIATITLIENALAPNTGLYIFIALQEMVVISVDSSNHFCVQFIFSYRVHLGTEQIKYRDVCYYFEAITGLW